MSWNWEYDNLLDDIRRFLKSHTIRELLELVAYVVGEMEQED